MKKSKSVYCKGCSHHWTTGFQDGGNWCSLFGKPCSATVGHCKNTNSRNIIASQE